MSEAVTTGTAELGDWIALLKPRVMTLVVFTGLIGLLIAPGHLHVVLAFAIVRLGAACCALDWRSKPAERQLLATRLTPRLVVSDAGSGEVLMFAWMSSAALAASIETGQAHFWSRSRGKLWKKGEESGNVLEIVEMRTDCDQDVVWLKVRVAGSSVACHTGARSCFYRTLSLGSPASAQLEPARD